MGLCVAAYFSRPFLSVCPCLLVLKPPFALIHSLIHFLALCINQSAHFVSTNFIPDPAIKPEREFTGKTQSLCLHMQVPFTLLIGAAREPGLPFSLHIGTRSSVLYLPTSRAHPNTCRHTHLLRLKRTDMNRQRQMGSEGEKKDGRRARERERK